MVDVDVHGVLAVVARGDGGDEDGAVASAGCLLYPHRGIRRRVEGAMGLRGQQVFRSVGCSSQGRSQQVVDRQNRSWIDITGRE